MATIYPNERRTMPHALCRPRGVAARVYRDKRPAAPPLSLAFAVPFFLESLSRHCPYEVVGAGQVGTVSVLLSDFGSLSV